jgi:hypothetical protein
MVGAVCQSMDGALAGRLKRSRRCPGVDAKSPDARPALLCTSARVIFRSLGASKPGGDLYAASPRPVAALPKPHFGTSDAHRLPCPPRQARARREWDPHCTKFRPRVSIKPPNPSQPPTPSLPIAPPHSQDRKPRQDPPPTARFAPELSIGASQREVAPPGGRSLGCRTAPGTEARAPNHCVQEVR